MTQKELLYYEDAIMHEINTISICNDIITRLEDQELISFVKSEIKKHEGIKNKLTKKLEECSNG